MCTCLFFENRQAVKQMHVCNVQRSGQVMKAEAMKFIASTLCNFNALLQVRKLDWLVWMTSCISTMVLGVETGLAISIGLALLIVIYESAFPHTALLGRVGNTTIYRNVKQFPNSQVKLERRQQRSAEAVVCTACAARQGEGV